MRYNIFINELDIYSKVDFRKYQKYIKALEIRASDCLTFSNCTSFTNVDVLLVGLRDIIDDRFMYYFPNVRYIVSSTTGVDHIQVDKNKYKVICLDPKDIGDVSATAEFTLGLILSLVRKFPNCFNKNKIYNRSELRGIQLSDHTIGIFGCGRIGKKLVKYCEALGMEILTFDKHNSEEMKNIILEQSNIISIHLPLNEETVDFISYKEFSKMKNRPCLINTSRAQIVNKSALLHALDNDIISGVSMDFINYDYSDKYDEELSRYSTDKVLLTPHIAGNTFDSIEYTANVVVDKLFKTIEKDLVNE